MATISNTPRPGYVWDSTDNVWYPIGTGPHTHADYITSGSAINPNIVDAKGDIIAATAADTVARLAVGSNDQVLTADSSTATGLKWATPSGGFTKIASGSFTTVSTVDIDNVFSTSYKNYFVSISTIGSTASSDLLMQYRYGSSTETGSDYYYAYGASSYTATGANYGAGASTSCLLSLDSGATDRETKVALWFSGVGQSSTNEAIYQGTSISTQSIVIGYIGGLSLTARIYTGFRLLPSTGTITGEYAVYGLAI